MDKRRWKNIIYKLLIGCFFLFFGWMVVVSSGFTYKAAKPSIHISIDHHTGHSFIKEEDIRQIVGSSVLGDGQLNAERLKMLEKQLERNPYIRKADVFINSKGELYIIIHQRIPVARTMTKSGAHFYIDEEGKKFPLSKNYTAKVPLITGWIEETFKKVDTIETNILKEALSVITYSARDSFWSAQVAQIHVAEDRTLVLLPRMGEQTILLGNSSDLEHKFRNLALFYEYVLNRQGWDQYKIINLQYKNQIVCK